MHFEEVVLCCDGGVNRNQVGATKVGVAVIPTWERGHISGRVAVFIDADSQEEGKLYQLELKPRCLPAVGGGARENNGLVSVEVHGVVLVCVVMPFQAFLLAADFAKRAWVEFHPGEEVSFVLREAAEVTG